MEESTGKNIFTKIEYPPHGFILQKDVYTTNLLYANDQFPLTELKKRIPFLHRKKKQNPSRSVRIWRENGNISENSEEKNTFYLLNNFKPKQLKIKKLKFPLPKIKAFPLTSLNLYEDINKKDIKIKNMDDDLNITSNIGRKILYKYKQNKIDDNKKSNFPLIKKEKNNLILKNKFKKIKHLKKNENDKSISMEKNSLKNIVGELNNELKNIKLSEIERKRAFIKDKFFSTQIYVENYIDSKNN